ncbi:MAG: hypothetical protein LH631_05835 [Alkalinema sp. CAN_BIN05]|nr:hypothetical protein [Alkalinema sp. CAN_BIN05]
MNQHTNQQKPIAKRHPALLPLLEDSPNSTVRRIANKEFIQSLSLLENTLSGEEKITVIEPTSEPVFTELDELADAVADIEAYIKTNEQKPMSSSDENQL